MRRLKKCYRMALYGLFAVVVAISLAIAQAKRITPIQLKRPVVVVPGIMGSTLMNKKTKAMVWDRAFVNSWLNSDSLNSEDLEAKDFIEGFTLFSFMPALPMLTGVLEGLGFRQHEAVYVFAFDWRQPVLKLKDQLLEFVRAKNLSSFDLVCISMGAAICAEYPDDPAYRVNKVALIGPATYGSPVSQRLFQVPQRRGLKASAMFSQTTFLKIHSLYDLMPRQKLSFFGGSDFVYRRSDDRAENPDVDFVHPVLRQKNSEWVDAELARAAAYWQIRGQLSESLAAQQKRKFKVLGSACQDTFGLAGDNTILAEDVSELASRLGVSPEWVCERHEFLGNNSAVVETLQKFLKDE